VGQLTLDRVGVRNGRYACMTIHYNFYRFGTDETAVSHLINGDLPAEDEERWRILDAPRYHIQRLLDEHLRAQAALRNCRDSGRPFVLYLRSFSSEYQGTRSGGSIGSQFSLNSVVFQQWLKLLLENQGIPLVKLHGGSDGFISDTGDDANVLSTHSENWRTVAADLIQAASAIIFLVSDMTAGVAEEFDLIRKSDRMHRCLLLLLDPRHTPQKVSGVAEGAGASATDFPNVFEFEPDAIPENLSTVLIGLLHGARTEASLETALNAEFTYLEPGFTASEDFSATEGFLWRQLRLLRVMFDDTYWAALKSHGIPFQHFTLPGAWKVGHQLYGLGIATADFRAIREALSYLSILYVFRGADFALLIDPLAAQYGELAAQIFTTGVPETESRYASGPDLLKLPAKISVALDMVQFVQTNAQQLDTENAIYLYQAAVVCALRAKDGDEHERRWIVANICGDWAKFQSPSQPEWAITNYAFAASLFRELAATDLDKYMPDLAMALNNLGTLHVRRRDFSAAEAAFVEALKIRRAFSPESENYMVNLYTSLANLGLLQVQMGDLQSARALYSEGLFVCDKRLGSDSGAIVDLIRLQGWMSLCLAKEPDTRSEGLEFARRAADNLAALSKIGPERAAELRELVQEAARVTS
jgi:tetratricopeptide (TPR) repeat protein